MATTTQETGRHIALVDIRVPDNVRDLDPEHVKALAGSIGLQGMLVPVVVRNDGEGFELVAGFHRVAAARSLGLTAVPVVIRDAQSEDADRAVENITRKQLNPYEEAKAVRAMLERGLTEDGAAQALGWPKQRVTACVKVLELPSAPSSSSAKASSTWPPSTNSARSAPSPPTCWTLSSPTSTRATPGPPSGLCASPAGCSTPPSATAATARCSRPTCTR
jgi:ParB/RepB/Spo0J family partition protein